MKNINTISVEEDAAMPSVDAAQTGEVIECMRVEDGCDDATAAATAAAIINCRVVGVGGVGEDNGDLGVEADDDDDDEAEEDEDDDDADDNDAVRDIVDELQQQHRQLLKDQQQLLQQQQQQQQQKLDEQQDLREQENTQQRGHLTYENANDYELDSDMICDVQMSANEMEVSSTVITNSNSDDSVNELNMMAGNSRLESTAGIGSSVGNVTIQLSTSPPTSIGHLQQQQHQQHQQQQQQQQQSQPTQPATERQTLSIGWWPNTTAAAYRATIGADAAANPTTTALLTQPQVPTVSASPTHQQQQHQLQVQQQLQRFQQQQQQQQQQHTQHMPAFQSLATQAQTNAAKYISKQMNLITMSRAANAATVGSAAASIASVAIPAGTAVSTYPPFSNAITNATRAAELIANAAASVSNASTSNVSVANVLKGLTAAGIPSTIAQQRPTNKLPTTAKGRKTVNNYRPVPLI
ncbi:unnamed protein product [Ceratitis capitata]|uniref:(Mediterranean fruit fly) hypothetical protein n=1 Tax=Ceratitis capitata TaxID=7213 RepID=A0A811VBB9_CERCA|nr:unnamed protein product [Ceratitis capitata]